ncbi:unnamed protein product, partial [Ectocarpus sp. 6 AP-2014]
MHGRCFRCGEKGHLAAACTKPEPLRCEKCLGDGHDKSKCSSEQAVLAVELLVLDATALDLADEVLIVVRDFTAEAAVDHEARSHLRRRRSLPRSLVSTKRAVSSSKAERPRPLPAPISPRAAEEEPRPA